MWWSVLGLFFILVALIRTRKPKKKPGEMERVTLPNGLCMNAYNKGEADIIYEEIWKQNAYLWPEGKLTLQPGDTVFDAGANTGMFSLFAKERCNNQITVFAFEPVPSVHKILSANATEHFDGEASIMHAMPYGLSDREEETTFLHHPQLSIWSTSHSDMDQKRSSQLYQDLPALTRHILSNDPRAWLKWVPHSLAVWGAKLIAHEVVKTEEVTCSLRTISSVIREHNLAQIDLLKIDVEGNELAVLQGLEEEHWPKVQQITMEVEDLALLQEIVLLLEQHGFDYEHEFTHVVHQSNIEAELSYLWAWRAQRTPQNDK